ncbi:MAG: hypothetical protein SFU53_02450 [Terrimicrobiaceae bacterium]|nr:hypothetical protein [Terrimicrobiaceae bacterium]
MSSPVRTLEFELRNLESALDNADCPFVGGRLNEQLAEAIQREAARGRRAAASFRIVFRPAAGDMDRADEVRAAVRDHFLNDAEVAGTELEAIFKDARRSGLLAISISVALFALSEILAAMDGRPLMDAISRGVLILAWVALWHPADLLLYAHLPIRRKRRLARALADADVVIERTK